MKTINPMIKAGTHSSFLCVGYCMTKKGPKNIYSEIPFKLLISPQSLRQRKLVMDELLKQPHSLRGDVCYNDPFPKLRPGTL